MDGLLQDLGYAVAAMRRNKAFAGAALATLALGIGATTAAFSVVYRVLLRPLPFATPSVSCGFPKSIPAATLRFEFRCSAT